MRMMYIFFLLVIVSTQVSFALSEVENTIEYQVDTLVLREIPEPKTEESTLLAIMEFKNKCTNVIPVYFKNRVDRLGYDARSLKITSQYTTYYSNLGGQYACFMKIKNTSEDFSLIQKSVYFSNGEADYEKCVAYRNGLETETNKIKLFDSRVRISWGMTRRKLEVRGCFVDYITISNSHHQ